MPTAAKDSQRGQTLQEQSGTVRKWEREKAWQPKLKYQSFAFPADLSPELG